MRTPHQQRVADFMYEAGQAIPNIPTIPDASVRELRCKLILEEALETIVALGFYAEVVIEGCGGMKKPIFIAHDKGPNLVEIADGCMDVSVVTIGTLLACGIDDKELLELVDNNNLAKFQPPKCTTCKAEMTLLQETQSVSIPMYTCSDKQCPEHCKNVKGGYRNEAGKWIKPSNHRPPDIAAELERQKHKMLVVDELEDSTPGLDQELFDHPGVRHMNISAPRPLQDLFTNKLNKALEEHRESEKSRFQDMKIETSPSGPHLSEVKPQTEPDPRLNKKCRYNKLVRGKVLTSGRIIGTGDIAPISGNAGILHYAIRDDEFTETIWLPETEVTILPNQ